MNMMLTFKTYKAKLIFFILTIMLITIAINLLI